jgi:hypothetical protein
MKNTPDKAEGSVLGDINPEPQPSSTASSKRRSSEVDSERNQDDERPDEDGSNRDRTEHAGSRDVTEATTGGTGPDVGGSRNYRTGSGVTGTDIGNRPK